MQHNVMLANYIIKQYLSLVNSFTLNMFLIQGYNQNI